MYSYTRTQLIKDKEQKTMIIIFQCLSKQASLFNKTSLACIWLTQRHIRFSEPTSHLKLRGVYKCAQHMAILHNKFI